MKATPMRAELWEFWRWTRAFTFGAGLFAVVYSVGVYWLQNAPAIVGLPDEFEENVSNVSHAIAWLMTMGACFASSFWPNNTTSAEGKFRPERFLLLPLKTWQLVVGYVAPSIVFVVGFATVAGLVVTSVFPSEYSWWVFPCAAFAGTSLLQTWLMVFGIHHAKLGIAITAALMFVGIRLMILNQFNLTFLDDYWFALGLGVVVVGYAVAIPGLALNRRGGFGDLSWGWLARFDAMEISASPARRFRDAEDAQRWYEWRRLGWHLPAISLTFLLGYYGFLPGLIWLFGAVPDGFDAFLASWLGDSSSVGVGFGVGVLVPAALAGAIALSFDLRDHLGKRSTFYLTRPRSHSFLVRARYSAVARNLLLAVVPVVCLLIFLWSFPGSREGILRTITRGDSPMTDPSVVAALVVIGGMFAVMWAAYWPVNVIIAVTGILVLAPGAVYMGVVSYFDLESHEPIVRGVMVASGLAYCCAMVGAMAWSTVRGLRTKAISPRQIGLAAAGWVATVAGLVWYRWPSRPEGALSLEELAVAAIFFGFTLLPAAGFVATPVLFHGMRHRR